MNTGYIKLYRSLEDNRLWTAEAFTKGQAWVDLILMANYTVSEFQVRGIWVKVKPGQIARGEEYLAKKWSWSRNKVRRFLNWLETEQQIEQQKSPVISIISIINWDNYQLNGTTNETTNETTEKQQTKQQKDTYKNVKNDKKNKEGKEVKNNPLPPFIKGDVWNDYLEMRKKIKKPATDRAKELAIKKLTTFHKQGYDPNAILEASIMNSWQDVYQPKDKPLIKRPSYNEDTHFQCRSCRAIKPKTEREGEICRGCSNKEAEKQGREFREKWEKMSAGEREKHIARLKQLNIQPKEWMTTGAK
jgi:hypothetical protein